MKEKIRQGSYELGNNLTKDLKTLIVDLLQFEPDQRPSFAKIINHSWMERMRKEIQGEVGRIKSGLQS